MTVAPRQIADAAEIARQWIRYQAMRWQIPGISFGMSHRGQVVLLDAWGTADIATQRAAAPDTTSYRCASITKTMTATLVMQQVEAGRLRLDEPIATYVDWTRRLPHAKDISIRHLLMHGSGVIRDGSNPWGDDDFPDRDTVRSEVRQQLSFAEPATTFRYSNIAYVLLGEVLEAVTGRPFEALLQRDVLGPLGMKGSAPSLLPRVRKTLATGYYHRRPGEEPRQTRHAEARAFAPAGRPRFDGAGPAHVSTGAFPRRRTAHLRPVTAGDATDAVDAPRGAESRPWLDDLARRRHHHPRAQRGYPGSRPRSGSRRNGALPRRSSTTRTVPCRISRSTRCSTAWRGWQGAGATLPTRREGTRERAWAVSRATTAAMWAR